jgi:trigger factor
MTNVETLGTLERRVSMALAADEIEQQVAKRLKELAKSARMPGFRPGKVPLKLIQKTYGPQVRSEVMSDAVQKTFSNAVREANLKVAGQPRIELKDTAKDPAAKTLEFNATFEIYPEVKVGDLATATIERPGTDVDEAAVDKTVEILRKQRTTFEPVERAAKDADRVTVDFRGTVGGEAFQGGAAEDFVFTLGEGRMLPEFEQAAKGMSAGEERTFPLTFPADYHGKEVAGKEASFTLKLKRVDEPRLPALDAEFAKSLGVADGDLAKMRADVRANVEREVKKRVEGRVKEQAMQALVTVTPLEVPKSLVGMEAGAMAERAVADLRARGVNPEQIPINPQAFEDAARRRVALGLIIAELARSENLQPKPAEVRALVEQEAQSYESPAEVVKWFYMQPQRLSEMEALALETNVVKWVLSKAKVTDKQVAFDELMGAGS